MQTPQNPTHLSNTNTIPTIQHHNMVPPSMITTITVTSHSLKIESTYKLIHLPLTHYKPLIKSIKEGFIVPEYEYIFGTSAFIIIHSNTTNNISNTTNSGAQKKNNVSLNINNNVSNNKVYKVVKKREPLCFSIPSPIADDNITTSNISSNTNINSNNNAVKRRKKNIPTLASKMWTDFFEKIPTCRTPLKLFMGLSQCDYGRYMLYRSLFLEVIGTETSCTPKKSSSTPKKSSSTIKNFPSTEIGKKLQVDPDTPSHKYIIINTFFEFPPTFLHTNSSTTNTSKIDITPYIINPNSTNNSKFITFIQHLTQQDLCISLTNACFPNKEYMEELKEMGVDTGGLLPNKNTRTSNTSKSNNSKNIKIVELRLVSEVDSFLLSYTHDATTDNSNNNKEYKIHASFKSTKLYSSIEDDYYNSVIGASNNNISNNRNIKVPSLSVLHQIHKYNTERRMNKSVYLSKLEYNSDAISNNNSKGSSGSVPIRKYNKAIDGKTSMDFITNFRNINTNNGNVNTNASGTNTDNNSINKKEWNLNFNSNNSMCGSNINNSNYGTVENNINNTNNNLNYNMNNIGSRKDSPKKATVPGTEMNYSPFSSKNNAFLLPPRNINTNTMDNINNNPGKVIMSTQQTGVTNTGNINSITNNNNGSAVKKKLKQTEKINVNITSDSNINNMTNNTNYNIDSGYNMNINTNNTNPSYNTNSSYNKKVLRHDTNNTYNNIMSNNKISNNKVNKLTKEQLAGLKREPLFDINSISSNANANTSASTHSKMYSNTLPSTYSNIQNTKNMNITNSIYNTPRKNSTITSNMYNTNTIYSNSNTNPSIKGNNYTNNNLNNTHLSTPFKGYIKGDGAPPIRTGYNNNNTNNSMVYDNSTNNTIGHTNKNTNAVSSFKEYMERQKRLKEEEMGRESISNTNNISRHGDGFETKGVSNSLEGKIYLGKHRSMGTQGGHQFMGAQGGHQPMGAQGKYQSMGAQGGHQFIGARSGHQFMGSQSGHPSMGVQGRNQPTEAQRGQPSAEMGNSVRPGHLGAMGQLGVSILRDHDSYTARPNISRGQDFFPHKPNISRSQSQTTPVANKLRDQGQVTPGARSALEHGFYSSGSSILRGQDAFTIETSSQRANNIFPSGQSNLQDHKTPRPENSSGQEAASLSVDDKQNEAIKQTEDASDHYEDMPDFLL
ncbi:hypothetical protein CDIK_1877 [Cucumispora dikerogammari]|nr:hypothetical protein CDIK_1877 [Cucumispora dikerogammari]